MSGKSQARDGRESIAFILEPASSALEGSSAVLAAGDIAFVLAAAVGGDYAGVPARKPIIANAAMSGTTGDKIVKTTAYFMGFANDKSKSDSKNTQDVTCDYDEKTNNVTDGQVSSSGSISGFAMTESVGSNYSALNIIKSRFGDIIEVGDSSAISVKEANTTDKDIIAIFWNWRNCKVGDLIEVSIVPVLFSNLNVGAQYSSGQSFSVDYTGNSGDENDYLGATVQVKATTALIAAIKALTSRDASTTRT